jgi:hypothetical protein
VLVRPAATSRFARGRTSASATVTPASCICPLYATQRRCASPAGLYGLAGWLSGLASASLRFSTNSDPADLDRPSHDSRCSHLNAERASVLTGFLVGSRSSSSARWVATSRSRSAQERSPWARARRLQDRSASPSHLHGQ